jgi:hypothetical protein
MLTITSRCEDYDNDDDNGAICRLPPPSSHDSQGSVPLDTLGSGVWFLAIFHEYEKIWRPFGVAWTPSQHHCSTGDARLHAHFPRYYMLTASARL